MLFQKKLPKFEGKIIPEADFLGGDFGKAVLKEYKGRIENDYTDNRPLDILPSSALDVLHYEDGIITGSNPFAVVLVNQILKEDKLRTANQSDLEKILKTNLLNLDKTYTDSALILRSSGAPNSYMAKILINQVRKRNPKFKFPIMIPLYGLGLVKDTNSPRYGLSFSLKDNAEIIYSPILSKADKGFSEDDIDEETGLPLKLSGRLSEDEGEGRILHNGRGGLCSLRFGKFLSLYSGTFMFDHYSHEGRIVIVKDKK